MARKFFAFSCLVLLISILYFIYTSYTIQTSKNQPEATAESEELYVGRRPAGSSFQSSAPENSEPEPEPEPTEEEWEAFENHLKNKELEDTEVASDTGDSDEAKASNKQISPELESLFIAVKQLDDRRRKLNREEEPFNKEFFELRGATFEILKEMEATDDKQIIQQLDKDFEWIGRRMNELVPILNEFYEKHRKVDKGYEALEEQYGISVTEFREKYEETYESWKADL